MVCFNDAVCSGAGNDQGAPDVYNDCCGGRSLFSYYKINGGDCTPCKCKLLLIVVM